MIVSIEVLPVGVHSLSPPASFGSVCFEVSSPPKSHRDPSLWQGRMTETGGVLVHIFECSEVGGRKNAYGLIEESDWATFRFRQSIQQDIWELLSKLLDISTDGSVWFFTDAQWSNDPEVTSGLGFASFVELHNRTGLRLNTAYLVT